MTALLTRRPGPQPPHHRAGRGPREGPEGRRHHRARHRRGRRRDAHARRDGVVLHPPRGRRQRDHPQRHLPRAARAHRAPRASATAGRPTSTALAPTAVEEIVRWATPGDPLPAHRHPGRRPDRRPDVQRGRQGRALVLARPTATPRSSTTRSGSTSAARRTTTSASAAPGPHFCLGAHLARREITVMFKELFQRMPDIRSVGEPERLQSNFINGIKHLRAEWTPASAG